MKKKMLAILLGLAMILSLAAVCSAEEKAVTGPIDENATVIFTDSVGREVEVPANITRVAISGPLAQIVIFALAPDKLVGIATNWSAEAEQYLATEYYNLPLLGQLYGGKGELNLEELLAVDPQVVIDVGEPKSTIAEDLDALQEQTGLPFVHITAYTDSMGDAYRMLGELLNLKAEAEVLASYCDEVYANTIAIMDTVGEKGKVNLLYCLGDNGLNVIAKGS